MGTRSYSDDDSEMEKQRKTERYAQTTSLSLGTRICGMQVCAVLGCFIITVVVLFLLSFYSPLINMPLLYVTNTACFLICIDTMWVICLLL